MALCVATFLYLLPIELRIDGIYEIAVNCSILLALGAFVLHLPSNRQPVVWNCFCTLLALYMAWGVISLLWAPDIVQGRRKLVAYGLGLILLFLTSNQVRTLRDLDKFMRVLAMIGWIYDSRAYHGFLRELSVRRQAEGPRREPEHPRPDFDHDAARHNLALFCVRQGRNAACSWLSASSTSCLLLYSSC